MGGIATSPCVSANLLGMAEWLGEGSEPPTGAGDRFIRRYVTRLTTEGGCKTDVAQKVVHDLLTELAEGITQLTDDPDGD